MALPKFRLQELPSLNAICTPAARKVYLFTPAANSWANELPSPFTVGFASPLTAWNEKALSSVKMILTSAVPATASVLAMLL